MKKILIIFFAIAIVFITMIGYLLYHINRNNIIQFLNSNENKILHMKIDYLKKEINRIKDSIEKERSKPSYSYLKSVTVIIHGEKAIYNEFSQVQEVSWMGTGVVYKICADTMYILTNEHVAPKSDNINIYVYNDITDTRIPAKVIATDKQNDISLIVIKNNNLVFKRSIYGIGEDGNVGDKVYVVGHHLGSFYQYDEGIYSLVDTEDILQLPTMFGNSGSGVFDKNGMLIGLCSKIKAYLYSEIYLPTEGHSIIIKASTIKKFLEKIENEKGE